MLLLALPVFAGDLHLALSARHFEGCETLGPADDALYTGLVAETDPTMLPPGVPIVAAECLIALYAQKPELTALMTPWMSDPERLGLALVVAGRIDQLPLDAAIKLAEAAKVAPERVRTRLMTSSRPEVVAVLQSTSVR